MASVCPICFLSFDTDRHAPRLFPSCGHSTCETCCRELLRRAYGSVKCPECRAETHLTGAYQDAPQRLQHLPRNVAMMRMLERLQTLAAGPEGACSQPLRDFLDEELGSLGTAPPSPSQLQREEDAARELRGLMNSWRYTLARSAALGASTPVVIPPPSMACDRDAQLAGFLQRVQELQTTVSQGSAPPNLPALLADPALAELLVRTLDAAPVPEPTVMAAALTALSAMVSEERDLLGALLRMDAIRPLLRTVHSLAEAAHRPRPSFALSVTAATLEPSVVDPPVPSRASDSATGAGTPGDAMSPPRRPRAGTVHLTAPAMGPSPALTCGAYLLSQLACASGAEPARTSIVAHQGFAVLDLVLKTPNPQVAQGEISPAAQSYAAHCIGSLCQSSALLRAQVPLSSLLVLQKMLQSPSPQVKGAAAYALQNILQDFPCRRRTAGGAGRDNLTASASESDPGREDSAASSLLEGVEGSPPSLTMALQQIQGSPNPNPTATSLSPTPSPSAARLLRVPSTAASSPLGTASLPPGSPTPSSGRGHLAMARSVLNFFKRGSRGGGVGASDSRPGSPQAQQLANAAAAFDSPAASQSTPASPLGTTSPRTPLPPAEEGVGDVGGDSATYMRRLSSAESVAPQVAGRNVSGAWAPASPGTTEGAREGPGPGAFVRRERRHAFRGDMLELQLIGITDESVAPAVSRAAPRPPPLAPQTPKIHLLSWERTVRDLCAILADRYLPLSCREAAGWSLGYLTKDRPALQGIAVRAGSGAVIGHLVHLISGEASEEGRTGAVFALACLGTHGKKCRAEILEEGACPALIEIVRQGSEYAVANSAWLLGAIAADSVFAKRLIRGLGALLPLMVQAERGGEDTRRNAQYALRHLRQPVGGPTLVGFGWRR